jgi:sugar/nucleoside kinase (ribokinase family)
VRSRAPDLAPLLAQKADSCLVVAHMPPCEDATRPAHVLVASAQDLSAEVRDEPWATGRRVAGERLTWVVITHGPRGIEAFGRDERLRLPAPQVDAVDTTGSGDAFAAGLIHALASGSPMRAALQTGVAWGAESTRWRHSALPREAVLRLLAR